MKFLVLIILALLVFSCSGSSGEEELPQEDVEQPVISITRPLNSAVIVKGSGLILNAELTDNVELKELQISLTMPVTKSTTGIQEPWQPLPETISLSGKIANVNDYLMFGENIPANCLSGSYILTFLLIDHAGNQVQQIINVDIF